MPQPNKWISRSQVFVLTRKEWAAIGAVLLVVVSAVCLRRIGGLNELPPFWDYLLGYCRGFLYIGLFTAWGISVQRRIIQVQTRHYMIISAFLMVFWFAVRTAKFNIALQPTALRWLWYLYYVPILLLPLLAVYVALHIGKAEDYRLPKRRKLLLFIPTVILILLVLTNDLHRWVFDFPQGVPWTDSDYSYAPLYYVVFGWSIVCFVTAIALIFAKCRVPHSRKLFWMPLVPAGILGVYAILYLNHDSFIYTIAGDMTAVQCLFFTATYECCIRCGFIQSNINYDGLFRISTIKGQIADKQYHIHYHSDNAAPITEEQIKAAQQEPVMIDDKNRLSSMPIHAGYVLWQDDVSQMLGILEVLQETQGELSEENDLLREEYKQNHRRAQIEEKNRLYDELRRVTSGQIVLLSDLLSALKKTEDEAEAKTILHRIVVIGSYLKRRNNLVLLSQNAKIVSCRELLRCLEESVRSLSVGGGDCSVVCEAGGEVPIETVMRLYDFFECAMEASEEKVSVLLIRVYREQNDLVLSFSVDCEHDLSGVATAFPDAVIMQDEDDMWQLSLLIKDGGAAE